MPSKVSSASLCRLAAADAAAENDNGSCKKNDTFLGDSVDPEQGSPIRVAGSDGPPADDNDSIAVKYLKLARVKTKLYVSEVQQFWGNSSCKFILLNAFITGIMQQVFETYLFVSLDESMHATMGFGGMCTFFSSISCAPVFYYSGKWIKEHGHSRCLLVANCLYCFRLVLLMFTPYNWTYSKQVLLIQHVFHGPSYALFWAVSVDAIFKQSPKHLGASCMGMLNNSFNVLGACIGSLFWGYVYEYFDGMGYRFYLIAIVVQAQSVRLTFKHMGGLDTAMAAFTQGKDAEREAGDGESDDGSGADERSAMFMSGSNGADHPGFLRGAGSHSRKPHGLMDADDD